jgi:hypothetical protein
MSALRDVNGPADLHGDPAATPPEAIEEPPITVDEASRLMAGLGFVAFRTPPGAAMPDSCLMAVIRDRPSRQHFDPEASSFWVFDNAHGRLQLIDRDSPMPVHRPFGWGRIRLVDRYLARNSFVSFGGDLDAERVGPDARLIIFRSPVPILRLPGHSQLQDRLAEHVMSFFGRLVPRLWSDDVREAELESAGPEALYAAFLLYTAEALRRSPMLRESSSEDAAALRRHLAEMARHRSAALAAGVGLLKRLELEVPSH